MSKLSKSGPVPVSCPEEPIDLSYELDDETELTRAEKEELDSMEARAVVMEMKKTLKEMERKKAGRPKLGDQDEVRYTVLLDKNKLTALQKIAYQRRLFIKQVFDGALADYIKKVEAEDGLQYL